MEWVLVWQAVIFLSIAFAGRARDTVTGLWVLWTIVQVFALWLSVLQFGTIWLAWSMFGGKKAKQPSQPDQTDDQALNAERHAQRALLQDKFAQEFKDWIERFHESAGTARWIPKGNVSRFIKERPAPELVGKTWKQAVGDASPADTLRKHLDKLNGVHLASQRLKRKNFFDTVEKNPLTDEQIHACVCMDDSVLIVAAAGSGKTSTMVAKTGYALHEGLATPDQILLLAFNKATAEEVGNRVAEQLRDVSDVDQVRSNTFHAFGIDVIAKATGKKPSLAPWVSPDSPGADIREVADIIKTLAEQDALFKRDWDLFRTVYARDIGRWGQRQEPDTYLNAKRGFLTAQGDIVKSKEERLIGDWLFYNGVAYVYERAYEHQTADMQYRQYCPDFFYPDADLYHEHFALNENGEAPRQFRNYLQGVNWKRQLHAEKGTAMVETTSHGLLTGAAIPALEKALIARGVTPAFDPGRPSVGQPPVDAQDLARSFRVFQQHVKNNGLTRDQLHAALEAQSRDGFGARLRMYLSLYERISAEWERRLQEGRFIDFEDMLVQAAEHVESKAYNSPYLFILADEFQDSSRARIRLLKALTTNPGVSTHLCVVGDDWQGINRFAGSDISVMTEFEKTFDFTTRLTLNTTFRCPQRLCDVSSHFIQANPAQIRKQVMTTNPLYKTPMLAYGFEDEREVPGYVEQQLIDMHRYAIEGKLTPSKGTQITVLFLGRYRRDRPEALERWQHRFGDRLKIEFRTAHGAKGLEAEYVFILNIVQGTHGFPSQIQDDPALQLAMPAPDAYPFAEERRLFYVAMTRARKQVRFYTSLSQPSQFLVELVKNEQLRIEPIDGETVEPCPRAECGGVMVPRSGGKFFGCSRFPACDQTRDLNDGIGSPTRPSQRVTSPVEAGQMCPICELGVFQQKNGRNGPFLGCSRFREGCRATVNLPGRHDSAARRVNEVDQFGRSRSNHDRM